MAAKKKRNSPVLLIVLAVLVIIVAVETVQVYSRLNVKKNEEARLLEELQADQQANDALKSDLEKADDEEFIKSLARELLGLAEDGERIFYDVND